MFCPLLKPVLSPVARGVHQACSNVAGNVVPVISLDLTAAPSASNAFDDYGLATSRTVTDYNGRIVEIPANAVPMGGLRPVRNLVAAVSGASSEDLTSTGWLATSGASIATVTTWTTSTTNSYVYLAGMFGGTPADGRVYAVRVRVSVSADCGVRVRVGGLPTVYKSIAASDGTVELAFDITISGASVDRFDLQCDTSGVTVTSTNFQVQDITHRADLSTAPDEYVSTADDYGTGVNGFRYFDTELANTVASNVVTEGTGDSIAGWLDYQPGATNKSHYNLVPNLAAVSATAGTPVLSVVAETTNYPAALTGLGDGNVYRVDNSAQGTAARVRCLATLGNLEVHSLQVWARSDTAGAMFGIGGNTGDAIAVPVGATYTHLRVEGQSSTLTWQYLGFWVPAGAIVEFIGQQLEEGQVCTAIIPSVTGASRPAMSPAPTISGLVGTEDARLTVKGLAADLVTPDPTDTTERTLDVDNTDGEFDTLPSPIKILSIDVYNDGERPA